MNTGKESHLGYHRKNELCYVSSADGIEFLPLILESYPHPGILSNYFRFQATWGFSHSPSCATSSPPCSKPESSECPT